ncbi:AAA family ATPase [Xanthomonas translucens]|uniref:AAA family ATPase n=1 Tax=Xanthomonas campestris pv. translucens TaxID=343 RepID=UPI001F1B6F99|nr:AAA family ATPase [Xanthomonas translucens]UKE50897.1 AAA family ATPase [Xanthomonas translucens]
MTILKEIFEWSKGLPSWQSDAISRLLAKNELDEKDEDDLLALLKSANGIVDSKRRDAKPLAAGQVPLPPSGQSVIILQAMKDLQHVNAIAPNQTLCMGSTGLTVIYGSNGSGKSGYSRVLKRACRARDQQEPIHPDAKVAASKGCIPHATFVVSQDGVVNELPWQQGVTPPSELSSIAVFDARCARAYLDQEGDYAYMPYGLEVFAALARLCQRLRTKIEEEIAHASVDLNAFGNLRGDTLVGKQIVALSAKTKPEIIESLATLSERETARCAELAASLRENNPKEKAQQARLRAQRFATLGAKVSAEEARLSESAVIAVHQAADAYRSAQVTAKIAAQLHTQGGSLLTGTGGEAWRELYEAARKFALSAYPEKSFTELAPEDACLLCQQPLQEGAERMRRFEMFVQAEAEKVLVARRAELGALFVPMTKVPVSFGLDSAISTELRAENEQLADDLALTEKTLIDRQASIKEAATSDNWGGLITLGVSPVERLLALAEQLNASAKALDDASDENARAALQQELNELNARVQLGPVKSSVLNSISKLSLQAKLKACVPALRTQSISLKASEVAEHVVSKDLADALNREFKALGVSTLSVSSQSRSARGKTLHRLRLELPQALAPSEILSEGEQRAIAIGSFLAEVSLSGQTGAVVFDDPVCSLDHRRRELVATRLTQEAAKRQVIVFTHDIYFLNLLTEAATRLAIPVLTQSLAGQAQGFGIARPNLPFEGISSSKRVGFIKTIHVEAVKAQKQGEEEKHHDYTVKAYYYLRLAWERAVEEVLLRNVVLRFRKGVETQRLSGVTVTDADHVRVEAGMAKCSNYAHDKAQLGGIAIPDPEELMEDIVDFEDFIKEVHARSEKTAALRKKGGVAVIA